MKTTIILESKHWAREIRDIQAKKAKSKEAASERIEEDMSNSMSIISYKNKLECL